MDNNTLRSAQSWKISKAWLYTILLACMLATFLVVVYVNSGEVPLRKQGRLDSLFKSSPSCLAPCWQNIRPGKSLRTDVQSLMGALAGNAVSKKNCLTYNGNQERCTWTDLEMEFAVVIEIRDGLVAYMRFGSNTGYGSASESELQQALQNALVLPTLTANPSHSFEALTLQDIVEYIGEPDEYSARISSGLHGEAILSLTFFYKEGIVVNGVYPRFNAPVSAAYPNCKLDVSLELMAGNVYFTHLANLRQAGTTPSLSSLLADDDEVLVWHGAQGVRLTTCNP